jgi:hypothetical protein
MNVSTRLVSRARTAGRHAVPTAAVIAALLGPALLATACAGSPHSHIAELGTTTTQGGTSTNTPAASARQNGGLAFSRCMRSHGVSEFPDPDSSGAIPKVTPQQLAVDSSQFQAAQSACAALLRPSNTQVQQTLIGMLDFSRCMRAHGEHNWPDPMIDRDGQAVFDLHGRINPDTPQMDTKSGRCARLLHPAPGQNGTVLCNGIGEAGCHHYG